MIHQRNAAKQKLHFATHRTAWLVVVTPSKYGRRKLQELTRERLDGVSGQLTAFSLTDGSRELPLLQSGSDEMTATMTDTQSQAVAAMEAAHGQGCSLTDYAKVNGLDVRGDRTECAKICRMKSG